MAVPNFDSALDDNIGDDLLRLLFTACHPVLPAEGRVALTLRLLGGLTTTEIARAFLAPEATIAQRIVRSKRTLAEEQVPYEVPRGAELAGRLSSVLEVIYLIFNEGYSATAGDDWMRPALCEEALRLGRIVAELAPGEAEVHGLVALMEIQASRSKARVGPAGEPVLPVRSESRALGSASDPSRPGRFATRAGNWHSARAVCVAGGNHRLPRASRRVGRNRLAADRRSLRHFGESYTVAGGRVESRRGGRYGFWASGWTGTCRRSSDGALAPALSSFAKRARRSSAETQSQYGGPGRVRIRCVRDAQFRVRLSYCWRALRACGAKALARQNLMRSRVPPRGTKAEAEGWPILNLRVGC